MTSAEARRAVSRLDGLAPRSVEPLGQGWAYWTFEVDGAWVFRFPRTAAIARAADKELRLLPVLAAVLDVPVPRPSWRGEHRGRPYFGYRKIVGRHPTRRDARAGAPLLRDLGRSLARLHALPADESRRLTGSPGTVEAWRSAHRRLGAQAVRQLAPVLGDAGAGALEAAFRAWEPRLVFTPALVHGDLNPDNMLVDEGGRLAGVIDWEDATAGDPAVDFAGLLRAYGARAAGEAVAAYGAADPGALLDRAAAYAWMADAIDALHALRHRRPEALARSARSLARRLGVRRSP